MTQSINQNHLFARKIILAFLGFLLIFFSLAALLFSPFGNAYIRNFLLSKLESQTHFQWEARHFKLTPSHLSLEAVAQNGQLELFLESEYSLFLRNFKGSFLLNSKGFSTKLADKTLKFSDNSWIEGEFGGEFAHYTLQAQSNLLDSESDLNAIGSYLELQGLSLHTKNASLSALFALFDEAPYGEGILNFDLKLERSGDSSYGISDYNGILNASLEGGDLDAEEFLSHFNLTIPPTHFMGELQGEIHHNTFKHYLKMYSSVGDFELKGASNLATLATNTEFHLNFQNLSPLSPFFGIPLNGALSTKGIAKGDTKNMLINGTMTLEHSPLDFRLSLQNLQANTLKITSQNLEASALFTLLNQPAFLMGVLNLDLDLRDFARGISGVVVMQSQNLLINSPLIEMHTHIGFPAQTFQMESKIELAQGKGILNYALNSNLASLQSQEGKISLQPFAFEIPQEVTLKKIQNFSYRNKSLFKGTLKAQGVVMNDSLNFKGAIEEDSNKQGNAFSLSLDKAAWNLSLNQLNSTQIYTIFPEIPHYFEGIANLNIKEDFTERMRYVHFDTAHLRFRNTALLRTLNQATQRNLAPYSFSGFLYHQILPDAQLHSTILLQSKDSNLPKSQEIQIQSSKIVTNLNTSALQGNLLLKRNENIKNHRLYGSIHQPKIQ
ncbi:hypothetical protein [Helicobacter sp.]|uniref:hypothetical protein n=1 Tax=Helicobacter sp. TaxID=218 RepID=UPI0019C5258C|nr:hypothetical protein [Helicobacter sp.]MBD5165761.1 hypothetical protein [Helicobacter sp.]